MRRRFLSERGNTCNGRTGAACVRVCGSGKAFLQRGMKCNRRTGGCVLCLSFSLSWLVSSIFLRVYVCVLRLVSSCFFFFFQASWDSVCFYVLAFALFYLSPPNVISSYFMPSWAMNQSGSSVVEFQAASARGRLIVVLSDTIHRLA